MDPWPTDAGFDDVELDRRIRARRAAGHDPLPVSGAHQLAALVAARGLTAGCWVLRADGEVVRVRLDVAGPPWWSDVAVAVAADYSWALTAGPAGTHQFLALVD